MSISPIYTVWCDEPECLLWEAQEPTKAEAWKTAKAMGWQRVRGEHGRLEHRCPDHHKEEDNGDR